MKIVCALGIAAALILRCSALRAECITPPPPCEALKQASVVALVEAIEGHREDQVPNRPGIVSVRTDVRLRILERFKGLSPSPRDVAVTMPFRAETAWLLTGKTYLVYAGVSAAGDWDTGCSRTRMAAADDEELRILRQCAFTPAARLAIERKANSR